MTAFIDARIARGQDDIAGDRPYAALDAFETALRLSADPARRITCLIGIDRAMLTTGQDDEAEWLWQFERQNQTLPARILEGFVENAIKAGRHDVASARLDAVAQGLPGERAWSLRYRCLIGLSEMEAAYESLDAVSDRIPSALGARYRANALLTERRYKEVLGLLSSSVGGRSSDLLQLRIRALIGTGQFAQVEEELTARRAYYPDADWIDYELARNATSARARELAVTRWLAQAERPDATPLHMRGLVEALLANLELDRAVDMIAVAAAEGRFDIASIRLLETQIALADGEVDRALPILCETIEGSHGKVTHHTLSRLWSERAKLELSKFFGGAEGDDWLARHVASAREAHALDPVGFRSRTVLIDALIRADAHDEAAAMIDALPRNARPETLRLTTWRDHRQGEVAKAQRTWTLRKRLHYFPQIENGTFANLQRIDENPTPPPDAVILYTVLRNERHRLPWFFEYYRGLGIRDFVVVDNGSVDGSLDYLCARPDVTLFSTQESYVGAFAGMVWINHLKSLFSRAGWALYVDVDEALVFDGCENHAVPDLVEALEREGAEAFTAYMLDMFARDILASGRGDPEEAVDFIARYPWYLPNIRRNPAPVCPFSNISGGARSVFSTREELTKTPLIKAANGVSFLRSSHNISPAHLSRRSGVLLHFKMIDGLMEEAQAVLNTKTRSLDCQMRYRKYLAAQNVADLLAPVISQARRYGGPAELVAQGLMPAFDWT